MATKYDVFAEIIEKAPCRVKDLEFKSPVYIHIAALIEMGWVKKKDNLLVPIKTKKTESIFKIVRYSLKHGLNHNLFLTKSMKKILQQLPKSIPDLRPDTLSNNKELTRALQYLEEHQFILQYSKKPARGRLLQHRLLNLSADFHGLKSKLKKYQETDLTNRILKIKVLPLNPFGDKVFAFLTGSAQLEGSTITEGDTKELLLKDIYPDKPAKDIQMVKNLNEALKYIIQNKDEDITPERIMEINKSVMFSLHANAGKYKITQNRIQGNPDFKTARPAEVPSLMQGYCKDLSTIQDKESCLNNLGNLHNQLQRIHPFSDGNSRTTRMVLNWILMKHNLPIVVIKMGSFDEYMDLTKLSKKRDDEKLNQLFLELIVHENL